MRPLLRASVLLLAIVAAGTLGYHWIEGAAWWDSFYMTMITLTTVGYREVFPLSRGGEAFTVALLATGIGVALFAATGIAHGIIEGELQEALGLARGSRRIERMTGHEIVCGWGRVGQAVAAELGRKERPFLVVERDPERVRDLREQHLPVVAGDATTKKTPHTTNVERARGLVACLNDDAHNVYTVLTARSLNASLHIVARAAEPGAEPRLLRAGANQVVNPYDLGGVRLAEILVGGG